MKKDKTMWKTALDKWSSKNIQIHLHTYSSLEGNRRLVAQQNCSEIEQMVIPVQNDFWSQIGTNKPESLVRLESFGHGVEGAFPLAPESEWEKQGRRVDVSKGLCPSKHGDSAAEEG